MATPLQKLPYSSPAESIQIQIMDAGEHLKLLLQIHLATDLSTVAHLPYIIGSLNRKCLLPSPHLTKWTTRIHSLLHSKEPAARWAGLCLAYETSLLSQNVMIQSAQNWLGIALPILFKNEPTPTLKAAIRLIRTIFTSAIEVPEFQRQVSSPNVPKFTTTLISLSGKEDVELRIECLVTLARIIPQYPTAHRASHPSLSALALRFLNGNAPTPTNEKLLKAASRLYSVLHLTGGKVNAANIWRKSIEDTLSFGWDTFLSLRTTFPRDVRSLSHVVTAASPNEDPAIRIALLLDRLRCCSFVLNDLLSTITYRAVHVPLGDLVNFLVATLSCTQNDMIEGFIDPAVRSMEVCAVPAIWKNSCELLRCVAERARHHLTPHLTRLVSILTFHLEQKLSGSERLSFLEALDTLLGHSYPLDSPLVPTRLIKAILPSLSVILLSSADASSPGELAASIKNKKRKKRMRNYEGDEVFKLSREVICQTPDEGRLILSALNVIQILTRNPTLSPAMHSISSRMLISILMMLPHMSPAILSADFGLHARVHEKVQTICSELGSGTTSAASKSLPLIIEASMVSGNNESLQRSYDLLLHPRCPPLVRTLPHVESLSLFRVEEPQEEMDAREALGLDMANESSTKAIAIDELPGNSNTTNSMSQPDGTLYATIHAETVLVEHPPLKTSETLGMEPGATLARSASLITPFSSASQSINPPNSNTSLFPGSALSSPPTKINYIQPKTAADDDGEIPTIDMESDSEGEMEE